MKSSLEPYMPCFESRKATQLSLRNLGYDIGLKISKRQHGPPNPRRKPAGHLVGLPRNGRIDVI
jgi:hypothetical protein